MRCRDLVSPVVPITQSKPQQRLTAIWGESFAPFGEMSANYTSPLTRAEAARVDATVAQLRKMLAILEAALAISPQLTTSRDPAQTDPDRGLTDGSA